MPDSFLDNPVPEGCIVEQGRDLAEEGYMERIVLFSSLKVPSQ